MLLCRVILVALFLVSISPQDPTYLIRRQLQALYDSTNGDNWKSNNWETSDQVCPFCGPPMGRPMVSPMGPPIGERPRSNDPRQGGEEIYGPPSYSSLCGCYVNPERVAPRRVECGPELDEISRREEQSWDGVYCDLDYSYKEPFTKIALVLENYNLDGPIPEELFVIEEPEIGPMEWRMERQGGVINFPQLASQMALLSLENNPKLVGSIPSTIGKASNLKYVYLINTGINGSIPTTIGTMRGLEKLYLNNNPNLDGPFPSEIGLLDTDQRREELDNINPMVEDLLETGRWSTSFVKNGLTIVDISNTNLSESLPPQLFDLGSLNSINFSNTFISGEIPSPRDAGLVDLIGSGSKVSGLSPKWLGHPYLEQLYLDNTMLTGNVFDGEYCCGLKNLKKIDVSMNKNLGGSLTKVGGLGRRQVLEYRMNEDPSVKSLNTFKISGCNFEGPFPLDIATNWENIEYLWFNENELISGAFPISANWKIIKEFNSAFTSIEINITAAAEIIIQNWEFLEYFNVSGNDNVYGTITTLDISSLKTIDFSNTNVDGPIPRFPDTITKIYLGNTLIGSKSTNSRELIPVENGEIPSDIGDLVDVELLEAQNTFIRGTVPDTVGNLQKLETLNIAGTLIEGPFPSTFGHLGALEYFNMDNILFNGNDLPSNVGNLSNIQFWSSRNANISGTNFVTEFTKWTNVKEIYINDNNITGEIPASIGDLTNLEKFVATNTGLSGVLPEEVCNLPQLTTFDVTGLEFECSSGTLPSCCQSNPTVFKCGTCKQPPSTPTEDTPSTPTEDTEDTPSTPTEDTEDTPSTPTEDTEDTPPTTNYMRPPSPPYRTSSSSLLGVSFLVWLSSLFLAIIV